MTFLTEEKKRHFVCEQRQNIDELQSTGNTNIFQNVFKAKNINLMD